MTPEQISRHDDERTYQPKILSRWVRELHRISEEAGEPMTVLVDRAVGSFWRDIWGRRGMSKVRGVIRK
jgi:hypothetical protein